MAAVQLTAPVVRVATRADVPSLFALINSSYHVESGDRPPAFKLSTRFLAESELLPLVDSGRVLACDGDAAGGALLGALSYSVEGSGSGATRAHFGPFAVARGAQGRGVGGALLRALEARARAEGCASIDAEVVDLRWDLFPMYFALGFRVVGQLPFPAPERCTRPCHFVCIRRELVGASSG